MASGFWGLGWLAGILIAAVNVVEPVVAALLVRRWRVHRSGLASARQLTLFSLAAGGIAPVGSGVAGALVISLSSGTAYGIDLIHWVIGHALGAVTFTPVFVQVASGELRRWWRAATARRIVEAPALLALVGITTAAVFVEAQLSLLFLPVLPLMLVTFRIGRVGAVSLIRKRLARAYLAL